MPAKFKTIMNIRQILLGILFCQTLSASLLAADPVPEVRVSNIRRVFHNGEHNAFTDLCQFQGKYYLTFRSCPQGHMVHPTSSILVLVSDDLKNWEQVHRFNVPLRDTRDPHFLIFQEKLFIYTGTWYCGETSPKTYDMNQQLGYAVWSNDGKEWSRPQMLEGTYGHYIWRAATHDGKAYLCGRHKVNFQEDGGKRKRQATVSTMLESDDGLKWRANSYFQTEWGDETAFLFEADGSVIAVARKSSNPAQLCKSKFPFNEWTRESLGRFIGGPLLAKWNGHSLVGGRKSLSGKQPVTALYWLVDDELQEIVELPSGGDNSYPGFIEVSPNKGIVSWYSSHEKNEQGETITAIYLADLEIVNP